MLGFCRRPRAEAPHCARRVKRLFDQNLSHTLVRRLADLFPDSVHVRDVGLKAAGDPLVWDYAKNNDLMILSKDSDFHQRSFLYGFPPKVVWVRFRSSILYPQILAFSGR